MEGEGTPGEIQHLVRDLRTFADQHASARRLYSAAEMIGHVADLFSEFAGLVHDNERRWRVFRDRVLEFTDTLERQRR